MSRYKPVFPFFLFLFIIINISCNPFAPALDNDSGTSAISGESKTIESLFENFKLAYNLKDTLLYGKLLDDNFTFQYRDYGKGVDVTWGRDEEMIIMNRLFQSCQNLDLIWNDIFITTGDSNVTSVIRFFNLSITFSQNDIVSVDGKVNLTLIKPKEIWFIKNWKDESNY
jgi:hypothetical protein